MNFAYLFGVGLTSLVGYVIHEWPGAVLAAVLAAIIATLIRSPAERASDRARASAEARIRRLEQPETGRLRRDADARSRLDRIGRWHD